MAFVPQTAETPNILASARTYVDTYVTATLTNPGGAILVTDGFMDHRALGPRYMQLHAQLTDFEIRDLFRKENNVACLLLGSTARDREWVTMGGPFGYTSVDHLTKNPVQALIRARQLVTQTSQTDVVWFLNHDGNTNTWSSRYCLQAGPLKDAMVVSKWPLFTFGQ